MMKWISAAVLAAAVSGVTANSNIAAMDPAAHQELVRAAIKAASGVPQLKKAEARRLKAFSSKMRSLATPKERDLQNNYNYNQNQQGGQYNGNQYNNNQQGENNYNQGQYYDGDYDGDYQWNEEMNEEAFGFDISAYSIKYTGCHTVETYNENLAGNEQFETMLGNQNYATFRLCPTETCNTNNKWGCDSNYGEYVVPLYDYVESIVGYGEARVEAFCGFCEDCAAREAYRSFANNQRNQMEYDMQNAEQVYETFKESYAAEQAYNANANGYYAEDYYGDAEDEDATYLVAYYQKISNMQQYNNQNGGNSYNTYNSYNGNQQQSNPSSSYNFYNQNMWQFSQNGNQNGNQQQNQQNNQQDTWSNMGQFASFGKHTLFPGYFSNQGEFVESWGYFLNGAFVSIEDGEVVWDEDTYGEMPAAWEEYIGVEPDEIEACDYQYSQSCYQSYAQCMLYLAEDQDQDQNDNAWMQNAVYADDQVMAQMQSYMTYLESQQQQQQNQMAAMTGEIYACRQVFYEQQDQYAQNQYNNNNNQYQNQQYNNAQYYQLNKYMNAQLEACNDNEACIYDIETQMQQNQDFMDWLEEYNENDYDQYVNGEKLYYIGATCAEDGDIGLSVYNDQDCSYVDESVTAAKILGFDPDEILNYDLIPSDCISCDNQDYMNDQFYYGEEEDNDNVYEGITPMCSMLYQIAGKCNENLSPTNVYGGYYENGVYVENSYDSMYQSYQQQENQDLVCSFAESLNSGTYDQSGQVYLDNSSWGSAGKWQEGIANASRNMPGGLKAALFLTALAAALMGVWACMLHGALARKNIPWQPKRGDGTDAVDIARQNSGIVMGRSRSGPVTHPLI